MTNVTLKSGTNELKGSVFFFGNTDATNASDYFTAPEGADQVRATAASRSADRSCATSCSSSATTSARIDNFGYVVRATVPTMAMRNGDFSAVAQRHLRSADRRRQRHRPRGVRRTTMIPQDRISPIARRLLALHSRSRTSPARRSARTTTRRRRRARRRPTAFDTKVNYTLSEKDQMSYRVSFMRPVVFDPGPLRHRTAARPTAASPAPARTRASARRATGRASSAAR